MKGAVLMALFYAFCSLAPAAAFAFGDGSQTAHCLIGDDDHGLHGARHHEHTAAAPHTHADGTTHDHGQTANAGKSDRKDTSSDGSCCGLFCVSALPANSAIADLPYLPPAASVAAVENYAAGQPAARLDRPPSTL